MARWRKALIEGGFDLAGGFRSLRPRAIEGFADVDLRYLPVQKGDRKSYEAWSKRLPRLPPVRRLAAL